MKANVPHRPRIRPGLAAAPAEADESAFDLWDSRRITHRPIRVSKRELAIAQLFDGRSTVAEIQSLTSSANGEAMSLMAMHELVTKLDDSLLLDSPRFADYLSSRDREPSCLGCYHAEPDQLRQQLSTLFTATGGPGLPSEKPPPTGSLRAILAPHMDFGRGNVTYGWAFKELFENTTARLFVIVATSHFSTGKSRYMLTRKDFTTPLGTVETDQAYCDRLASHYGDELFCDPYAHLPEHSIELEVVLLQYLYERHRPFRIVPLLVGSFHDAVVSGHRPDQRKDVARMAHALAQAEKECGEEVCYVISGDLAHIGPRFDDPEPVNAAVLAHSRAQDQRLLAQAAAANGSGYHDIVAEECDARRICGYPPSWTTLTAARPSRGRLLHYQQYVHPQGYESVSFASMAFDQ